MMVVEGLNNEVELFVELQEPSSSSSEEDKKEEEGDDSSEEGEESSEESEGDSSEGEGEDGEGEDGEGEGEGEGDSSEGDSSEGDSSEGDSSEGDSSEGDSSEGEDGEESGEDGEDGEGEDGEGEGEDGEGEDGEDGEGEDGEDGEDGEESGEESGEGEDGEGEGGSHEPKTGSEPSGSDSGTLAEDLLESMAESKGMPLDSTQAMMSALAELDKKEKEENNPGEALWRPCSTSGDRVVKPRVEGEAGKRARAVASRMREATKISVSSLTNKLRAKFLQARSPRDIHGVQKGAGLSDRRLVESFVEIKSQVLPTRPDWLREKKEDCSLSCAIVLDESGSMKDMVLTVGMAALAVAEPLSNLGSPCLVIGPRDAGPGHKRSYFSYVKGSHRNDTVTIDLFKDWDEKISLCWERFGKVMAAGSTPLEDGIQYALQEINTRKERHRVILVVTDGCPNNSPVVKRQIRIAKEAGVSIIGIGIGSSCHEVPRLFPEHVQVPDVHALPQELLKLLDGIMFPKEPKKIRLESL